MPAAPTPTNESGGPLDAEDWSDYLTPEQRVAAIAEILATAALRVIKERHETDPA